jgi:ubiquinone/menaquinone biosynthesis C-methylase UbiE
MEWYKIAFEGDLARYWNDALKNRENENNFLNSVLKNGLVLDLCCGPGKHSTFFSKYKQVVSLDLSRELLEKTREECKNNGRYENANLIRADMRYLPFRSDTFDNVVDILAFGFFSDKKNESVVQEIVRILKKDGVYVYNNMNCPEQKRSQIPKIAEIETENFNILRDRKYYPKTKRVHVALNFLSKTDGKTTSIVVNNRLYNLSELKKIFLEKGLTKDTVYGSFEKEVFDENNSSDIIIVSHKE